MSKKRVYELAKELGLENRELISRLEKIGIAVKSHSSTLEDGDLERIKEELLSPEPREVAEKRIKPGVIRRRAFRMPTEESPPPDHRGLDSLFNHLAGFGRKQFLLDPLQISVFERA